MLIEFSLYFVVLLLVYLLGLFYNKFCISSLIKYNHFNNDEKIVLNLASGIFSIIIITSVFFSCFRSINLIFFFFLILTPFLINREKSNFKISFFRIKKIFLLILFAFFFFIYNKILFLYDGLTPFYDFLFLSKISRGLVDSGVESVYSSTSFVYGVSIKPHIYHYYELWFNGGLSKLFDYSEYNLLLFVTFPIFHLLVFLLIYIITRTFVKGVGKSILLSFGLLFGFDIFLPIHSNLMELVSTYRGLPYSLYFKLLPIYIYGLLSYYFYLKKINQLSVFALCSILIFYPTTIPSISFLALIVFLYELFKEKRISKFSIAVFFTVFYIIIFQKIFNFESKSSLNFHQYDIKQYIVLFVEYIFKIFIEHWLTLVLIIYMLFFSFRNLCKNRIVFYVLFSLLGPICYILYNPPGIRDLNQIVNNISPVLLLILTLELIKFIRHNKFFNIIIVVSCIIGVFNIYQNYKNPNEKLKGKKIFHSNDFIQKLETNILGNDDVKYCSFSKVQPPDYYYHVNMNFNYLLKLKKFKTPLEINLLFSDNKFLSKYSYKNIFYPPNSYFSLNENNIDNIYFFLKDKGIKFLLFENSINVKLEEFIKKFCNLEIRDENTGDCLYSII